MINTPPPLKRDCTGDPNIEALQRRGFITQGYTFGSKKPGFLLILASSHVHPSALNHKPMTVASVWKTLKHSEAAALKINLPC